LDEVAYIGAPPTGLKPTATNSPEAFTAKENGTAVVVLPFITAGEVQVEPLDEVAYAG
jgi:hypothetical protein